MISPSSASSTSLRRIGDASIQALHNHARSAMSALRGSGGACPYRRTCPQARNRSANSPQPSRDGSNRRTISHPDLAEMVLEESGYTDMLKADKSPESRGDWKTSKSSCARWKVLNRSTLFSSMSLVMELEQNERQSRPAEPDDAARGKGLEFEPYSCPAGKKDCSARTHARRKGMAGLEEERRASLMSGLTRAKSRVFVSVCGQPARARPMAERPALAFIGELPEAHVDKIASEDSTAITRSGLRDNLSGFGQSARLRHQAAFDSTIPAPAVRRAQEARANMRAPRPSSKRAPKRSPQRIRSSAYAVGERVFHQKFGYAHRRGGGHKLLVDSRSRLPSASWTASSARHDFASPLESICHLPKDLARTSHRCSS